MMTLKKVCLYIFLCFFCCWQVQAATIKDIRFANFDTGDVRIVIETDVRTDFKYRFITNPDRLIFDVTDLFVPQDVKQKEYPNNPLIKSVRFGTHQGGITRIVFDFKKKVYVIREFILPPQMGRVGGIWRYVVDVRDNAKKEKSGSGAILTVPLMKQTNTTSSIKAINTPQKKTTPTQSAIKPAKPTIKQSVQPFNKPKKHVIMLDPGHGGKDPGAISKSGHYEKDLTLKMGRELRKMLEKAGYKVVMTRDSDIYISLRGRVKKAHQAQADLFISIHADSSTNSSAKGLSIYTLSETSSDREAAALAERENKSDILFEMDLGDVKQDASTVLIDLAQGETMKQSRNYADLAAKELRKNVRTLPQPHRHAGFAVLKSPSVPAVLLEMGYLSNRQEEAQLQKASYRQKLGTALVKAINNYFSEYDKALSN